jgi:hypothetical protein
MKMNDWINIIALLRATTDGNPNFPPFFYPCSSLRVEAGGGHQGGLLSASEKFCVAAGATKGPWWVKNVSSEGDTSNIHDFTLKLATMWIISWQTERQNSFASAKMTRVLSRFILISLGGRRLNLVKFNRQIQPPSTLYLTDEFHSFSAVQYYTSSCTIEAIFDRIKHEMPYNRSTYVHSQVPFQASHPSHRCMECLAIETCTEHCMKTQSTEVLCNFLIQTLYHRTCMQCIQ